MPRPGLLCLLCLCVSLGGGLVATPAAAGAGVQVLIAPFPPSGLSETDAARLDTELRAATAALPGVDVQSREDTERALTAMKQMGLSCHPDETRCLVQLGALAGAARVISTAAVVERDNFRVTLRLVDIAGGSELRNIDGVVPAAELRAGLEGLTTGLLLPSLHKGELQVDVSEARAMILVDGELRGTTPLANPLQVRAGKRTVRIEKDGFAPVEQVVVVPFNGLATIQAELSPGESTVAGNAHRTRVLVLDLLAEGSGLPNPRTLASLVAVELARDPGLDVLSGTDVDQLVSAAEAGMEIDCKDTGCLTDLAGAFDVPFIVHGDIGLVGSVLIVHLDVFDAERLETVARTSVENHDRDRLPEEIKVAARKLLSEARAARPELSSAEQLPAAPELATDSGATRGLNVRALGGYTVATVGAVLAVAGVSAVLYYRGLGETYAEQLQTYDEAKQDALDGGDPTDLVDAEGALRKTVGDYYPVGPYALPAGVAAMAVGIIAVGSGLAFALLSGDEE